MSNQIQQEKQKQQRNSIFYEFFEQQLHQIIQKENLKQIEFTEQVSDFGITENLYHNIEKKQSLFQQFTREFDQWDFASEYIEFFKNISLNSYSGKTKANSEIFKSINYEHSTFTASQMHETFFKQIKQRLQANNFQLSNRNTHQSSIQPVQFLVSMINSSNNNQIIEFNCEYGSFSKIYFALNYNYISWIHERQCFDAGGMSRIYCNDHSQKSIIKCSQFNLVNKQVIKQFIKQFFIADIMSSLEIGPKILKRIGFDFIIFQNCIEFQMQRCLSIQHQHIQTDLKQNLLKMHFLKFVHCDLKPENVMFSQIFNKNVFIDFGISELLHTYFGGKSLTKFKGTYEYCGNQMKKIISKRHFSPIDLYKNDVQMLKKCIKEICENSPYRKQGCYYQQMFRNLDKISEQSFFAKINKALEINSNPSIVEKYKMLKLKYLLYKAQTKLSVGSQIKQILNIIQGIKSKQAQQNLMKEILKFIERELKSSQNCIKLLIKQSQTLKSKSFLKFSIFNLQNSQQTSIQYSQRQNDEGQVSLSTSTSVSASKINILQSLSKHIPYFVKNDISVNTQRKLQMKNLEFILFNMQQILKFEIEEYLQLFLEYVSFWKSSFKINIEKKIQAAKLMKIVIQNSFTSTQWSFFLQTYAPEEYYVRNFCSQIVQVYKFLLNYCYQGQNSKFKQQNSMTIFKDCVILNFKTFYFGQKYFSKYIQRLISEQADHILAKILIQKLQIEWLFNIHFSIYSERQVIQSFTKKQKRQKFSPIELLHDLKNTLKDIPKSRDLFEKICFLYLPQAERLSIQTFQKKIFEYETQKNDKKTLHFIEMYPQQVLKLVDEQFLTFAQQITKKKQRVSQINKNFQVQQLQSALKLYQKVIFFTNLENKIFLEEKHVKEPNLKSQLKQFVFKKDPSHQKSIFRLKFEQISAKLQNLDISTYFTSMDNIIGCINVSRYFYIHQRLRLAFETRNYEQMNPLIKIIVYNSSLFLMNDYQLKNIRIPAKDFYYLTTKTTPKMGSYVNLRRSLKTKVFGCVKSDNLYGSNPKIILEFFQLSIDYNFYQLSQKIKNNKVTKIDKEIDELMFLIKQIKKYHQIQNVQLQFNQIKTIVQQNILHLYQSYLQECKTAKQIYFSLQLFRKKLSICLLKLEFSFQDGFSEQYFVVRKKLCQQILSMIRNFDYRKCYLQKSLKTYTTYLFYPQLILILHENNYLGQILQNCWSNIKQILLWRNQNIQLKQNFQSIFTKILESKDYELMSELIIFTLKQLIKEKRMNLLKLFNQLIRNLMLLPNYNQHKFFDTFFKKEENFLIKNFQDKLIMFPLYINIISSEDYFYPKQKVWKKILIVTYYSIFLYPKFIDQPKNLLRQRKQQLLLSSIQYLDYKKSVRKKHIKLRQFVKNIQKDSQYSRLWHFEWIIHFLKMSQADSGLKKKIKQKKLEFMKNNLQPEIISDILKGYHFNHSQKYGNLFMVPEDIRLQREFTHSIWITQKEKQFKHFHQIKDLSPFYFYRSQLIDQFKKKDQPVNVTKDFVIEYNRFLDSPLVKQNYINGLFNDNPFYFEFGISFGDKNFQEVNQNIQQIKKSHSYQICEQTFDIISEILKEEKLLIQMEKIKQQQP